MITQTYLFLLVLLLFTTICNSQRIRGQIIRGQETCPPPQNQSLSVEFFCPNPILITLDSLPEPFSSESVAKPPQVVPIPENPVLNVPRGFGVNIFVQDLKILDG